MSYLLDTNVVSELVRPRPTQRVVQWLSIVPQETLHISVLSLGELRKGIERLGGELQRAKLRRWLEIDLNGWFGVRVLDVDRRVADRWGRLLAALGRPAPAIDSLLAATAIEHGLSMVTRNEVDFTYPDLQVINPWTG